MAKNRKTFFLDPVAFDLAAEPCRPPGGASAEWTPQRRKAAAKRMRERMQRRREAVAELLQELDGPIGQVRRQSRNRSALTREQQIIALMEPGEWYGAPDLCAASGAPKGSSGLMSRMESRGWIRRARNPEFDRSRWGEWFYREPEWLWCLTAEGVARRRGVAADGDSGCEVGAPSQNEQTAV